MKKKTDLKGMVVIAIVIGAALSFKGLKLQQQGGIPVDAVCTVVCATRDVPDGIVLTADAVKEQTVKVISIPKDFVSHQRADATYEISHKHLDWYETQIVDAVGRLSTGMKKEQLIVHRMSQQSGLGGADFLPVPNKPN